MQALLADTSVWVAHLRGHDPAFAAELEAGHVLMHPAIMGELATLNLKDRDNLLHLMRSLPAASEASHEDVLDMLTDETTPRPGPDRHPVAARGPTGPRALLVARRRGGRGGRSTWAAGLARDRRP